MKTLASVIALAFFALTSASAFAADKPAAAASAAGAKAPEKAASAAADKKPAKKEKKGGC